MKWTSSIKFRLIVWNALVVMIIYGIAATGIYFFMRHRLESLVMSKLDEGLGVVCAVTLNSRGDVYDWYHLGHSTPFLIVKDGTHAYHTTAWSDLDLPLEYKFSDFGEEGLLEYLFNQRHFLLKTRMVQTGFDKMHNFLVVTAMEDTETRESIDGLGAKLASGAQFVLILALLGGYFLANRALRPVKLITRKAREITAQSLSERLPVVNPKDEIGQLATVFNDTLQRLETSFERLKRFTSDASHEFRTPLTSIRSIGEVALKDEKDVSGYMEAIGSMLEETERLTKLVNSLLILTRGDSGRVKLDFEDVDLNIFIAQIAADLKILAEDKDISLLIEKAESLQVNISPLILGQAVSNVLHNAILYTPEGGNVRIRTDRIREDTAQIDIIDNGPGIPEDKRKTIFERFYRIDKSRAGSTGGAGLGLSIAQWAVEANGGAIEFCDTEERGSCCRISIPLSR